MTIDGLPRLGRQADRARVLRKMWVAFWFGALGGLLVLAVLLWWSLRATGEVTPGLIAGVWAPAVLWPAAWVQLTAIRRFQAHGSPPEHAASNLPLEYTDPHLGYVRLDRDGVFLEASMTSHAWSRLDGVWFDEATHTVVGDWHWKARGHRQPEHFTLTIPGERWAAVRRLLGAVARPSAERPPEGPR